MQLTKKDLHKTEMDLAYLFDENKLTREAIIEHFTNLMCKVDKAICANCESEQHPDDIEYLGDQKYQCPNCK